MGLANRQSWPALQLWGGHECTINRVGDTFTDQSILTGHDDRIDDFDRVASLRVKRVRYPVLWEKVSPIDPGQRDWRVSDRALGRLRELGLSPIVGLVHHGSGPAYTNLLSPNFATGLAEHAARVAERYPWIDAWTPINEPLTTARFSALYGHWYPHRRDEHLFWQALLNQIDGIRLAMRAIREIAPAAALVQTEDLGKTYATERLADQAMFDNERRWASWDLLAGRVVPGHPLHARMASFGLEARLEAIAAEPCPADILGINHYLTSDRYLDECLEEYPLDSHGGNGSIAYADVAAVRVPSCRPGGMEGAVREAHERYGTPIALTEVHNGCSREEQMRWLLDAWEVAQRARATGIDVVAVTAWSLFGSYDWNSLLTKQRGDYESGAWDARFSPPRETALGRLIRGMGSGVASLPANLEGRGWWQNGDSLPVAKTKVGQAPILITGATGTLGQAFAGACRLRNLPFRLTSRDELPLHRKGDAARALDAIDPWLVINAAGWVRVDEAEQDPHLCMAANAQGAIDLAELCAERRTPYVSFSSDLVFDGLNDSAYVESDAPSPLNVYGRSKAVADAAILKLGSDALIVRTAAFFSPYDVHNFAVHVVRTLKSGNAFRAASDTFVSPTYVPDLVRTVLDLAIDGEYGLWHLSNETMTSWFDFARQVAIVAGQDPGGVLPALSSEMGWIAPRPKFAGLRSERGRLLPSLDRSLEHFVSALA